MKTLLSLFDKAKHSRFHLWLLNRAALRMIPFNNQHGFIISAISDDSLETMAPYKRRNMNHLKGIHACGLATIGELSAGLLLLSLFDPSKYRLIMSHLEVSYHYQAKTVTFSRSQLQKSEQGKLLSRLSSGEVITLPMASELYDSNDNHVATVKTTWQLKPWSKAKTKR